jgi:PilZ domain
MNDNDSNAETTPSQRPRSPRVPVDFSLVVEGKTATGDPFEIRAAAIKISRGGATLLLDAEVEKGARLFLTPPFGRKLEAEINGVWIDENDGKQRVGVKLLDENGWFAD